MLELIINKEKEQKTVSLIENGRLLEQYEENNETNINEGSIYIGVIKDIIDGMQSAFVDIGTEKNSFIYVKDLLPKKDESVETQDENIKIRDVVKKNDRILVQVKKDSYEKKGARVSTHISLVSKYIVLMPNTTIVTISRKIEKEQEKNRLLEIIKKSLPQGYGAIIRTSAEGKSEKDLVEDIANGIEKWNQILEKYNNTDTTSPVLICKNIGITEKIIIDIFEKLDRIIVNDKTEYENILKILEREKLSNIELLLREIQPILNTYEIEKQVSKIKERKIWLSCGGFITIDRTEALTAIDVNTAKYTGEKNLEDTVYKVNKEATIEIAKQLRLRDIGGIIVIDYIDMKKEENKEKIQELLKEELKKDRAKTQVEGFTKLDLMELTRKHICSQ